MKKVTKNRASRLATVERSDAGLRNDDTLRRELDEIRAAAVELGQRAAKTLRVGRERRHPPGATFEPSKAEANRVRMLRKKGMTYAAIDREMGWPDRHGAAS